MGNSAARSGVPSGSAVEVYSDYDENTINRGTSNRPKPLLKFHSVHGTNVTLLNDGRIARRKDSFCKGLVFSNRPISVDEIICLRLCDVGTNWSGVLRFGVTNVDPASFRDIELPKFACPDLTSKAGYWAKALAERYSVNDTGEMYYGINGVNKGLFLNGINVSLPIWIIIDIYGNSVGVEFVDPGDVNVRAAKHLRTKRNITPPFSSNNSPRISEETANTINDGNAIRGAAMMSNSNGSETANNRPSPSMTSSTSASNLGLLANSANIRPSSTGHSTRTSPFSYASTRLLRFHTVHGVNISLHGDDTIASRKHGEYYLGYVFTERPLKIGEKLAVVILQVEDAFSGSLAFGLTSCDPTQVPASRLPVDSDELLERPEYWVCIKDVGAMPAVGDKLCFHIDSSGQVTFSKNDAPSRVIMHVDISVNLWAFFDLYGTTRKFKFLTS
uniref:NHR domain-containing protein n=1 Tax=Ditylenchus dipsaci TaxID=166011 RepID=A0A915D3T9_9BILA